MKFWLLTLTRNQVLRLAMLKTILRRRRRGRGRRTTSTTAAAAAAAASAEVTITLASEIINPTALPCVFLQPKKGLSVQVHQI